MAQPRDADLLPILLDAWDRNQRILVNLLRALPAGGLAARAMADGPTVASLFAHAHYVRLAFVEENVPERALAVPAEEWADGRDPARIEADLDASARAVREAVLARLASGAPLDRHYDHPVLFLQHMIWHEGYHHGQIKLALKSSGLPLADREVGRGTWGVWMSKTEAGR